MGEYERQLAGISPAAVSFYWMYPAMASLKDSQLKAKGLSQDELNHSIIHLLRRGAFVYQDANNVAVQINVVTNGDGEGYIQFDSPAIYNVSYSSSLPADRFQTVPMRYREAESFAW